MKYIKCISGIVLVVGVLSSILYAAPHKKSNFQNDAIASMSINSFENNKSEIYSFVGECETGELANQCCPYWDVEVEYGWDGPKITCSTGGDFKCKENCDEDESED